MENKTYTPEDKKKIEEFITASIRLYQEIEDCRESLKDTAKTLAEQLDIKPAILLKAASFAFKESIDDKKDELDDVEEILHISGRR